MFHVKVPWLSGQTRLSLPTTSDSVYYFHIQESDFNYSFFRDAIQPIVFFRFTAKSIQFQLNFFNILESSDSWIIHFTTLLVTSEAYIKFVWLKIKGTMQRLIRKCVFQGKSDSSSTFMMHLCQVIQNICRSVSASIPLFSATQI